MTLWHHSRSTCDPEFPGQLGQCVNIRVHPYALETAYRWFKHFVYVLYRVASHLFTGGLAGIDKLLALVGWYIWYGITAYTIFLPLAYAAAYNRTVFFSPRSLNMFLIIW
jgi:hypothetical protein